MSLILYLILLAASGLIVGALGRLALPGPDPMSVGQTILVGLAGSFVAGLAVRLIFHSSGAGLALSVLCATGIVYAIRRRRGGPSLSSPPERGRPR